MPKASTTADYARRLARVDVAIEENLDSALTPMALAKVAAFAPHHFHRIYRTWMVERGRGKGRGRGIA